MIQLLIVDDEKYILQDIEGSICWKKLGISTTFTALNMRQAKEVFQNNKIDIMLCDIEMPQGSGLELLSWVRENYPKTESIFLTCHEDFRYAKEAIRLGSLDYILKPIPYEELEAAIANAIDKISKNNELEEYSRYGQFWFKNQSILMEDFWLDILNYTIPSNQEDIKRAADERNIPYTDKIKILPLLISVQRWYKRLSLQDEKIMEFGLKNVAEEMLAAKGENGQFLKLRPGMLLGILMKGNAENSDNGSLIEDCKKFITACNQYIKCDLSCYIGNDSYAYELAPTVDKLLMLEKNNVAFYNNIFILNEQFMSSSAANITDMSALKVMIKKGLKEEGNEYVIQERKSQMLVNKVKDYIRLHLDQELTREQISGYVYLNPDYLDRVFKKETGVSVAKYMMQERLKVASELLLKTEVSISEIAAAVGYTNLSNFSSMFKKMRGMNPAEYRKNVSKGE